MPVHPFFTHTHTHTHTTRGTVMSLEVIVENNMRSESQIRAIYTRGFIEDDNPDASWSLPKPKIHSQSQQCKKHK